MRLIVTSDWHLEFTTDKSLARFSGLIPSSEDEVLIIAGDCGCEPSHLVAICRCWVQAGGAVIAVLGNHDYYGREWDGCLLEYKRSIVGMPNIYLLENEEKVFKGIRFLGTSLWTDFGKYSIDTQTANEVVKQWSRVNPDRGNILHGNDSGERLHDKILCRHKESLAWLESVLPKDDPKKTVVVTHWPPSPRSNAQPRFGRNDVMKPYFVGGDAEKLVNKWQPIYWFHGHTHTTITYKIGDTTVASNCVKNKCNPLAWRSKIFSV